jgi:hypothetical protein
MATANHGDTMRLPDASTVKTWSDEIAKNGSKRIKLRGLLKHFGAKRRGPVVIATVKKWFRATNPRVYVNGLLYAESLDDVLHLAHDEFTRIGRLVEQESNLADRFEKDILRGLRGLSQPVCKYRPKGTRDELDFLCTDEDGRAVVVELKKEDGKKSAVEQVLRYINLIRDEGMPRPRGILITGVGDMHTRRALREIQPGVDIEWYVYGLAPNTGRIRLRRIEVERAVG